MTSGYDVHDHERFDRPGRRSRPRTKQRPSYDDAHLGRVITIDRGRYTLLLDDADDDRLVMAMKARALGRGSIVVGDDVRVVGDVSGAEGTLARIVVGTLQWMPWLAAPLVNRIRQGTQR